MRKDLSFFGSFGKRGLGYAVEELLRELEEILGLNRRWNVALVGAGKIGSALITYRNFQRRGFEIRAVFDADPAKIGQRWGEQTVLPDAELERVLREKGIEIVIVAVPADAAQAVVDRVVGERGAGDPELRPGAPAGARATWRCGTWTWWWRWRG